MNTSLPVRIARLSLLLLALLAACPASIHAAPLPPLGEVDLTGTIAALKWVPEQKLKGKPGMSGSLGRDRTLPAHFEITLRPYSGPTAQQAWMMNGFMGVRSTGAEDRSQMPASLIIWISSEDPHQFKPGQRLRIRAYTVRGDEGGTWTSHAGVEVMGG